jgi:hypothetical protein
MHDKGSAIVLIDESEIAEWPFIFGGEAKNLVQQLALVRRTLELQSELAGEASEFSERFRVDLVQPKRRAGTGRDLIRQRVERREIVETRGIWQVAENGRVAGRRRLGGMLFTSSATTTGLPVSSTTSTPAPMAPTLPLTVFPKSTIATVLSLSATTASSAWMAVLPMLLPLASAAALLLGSLLPAMAHTAIAAGFNGSGRRSKISTTACVRSTAGRVARMRIRSGRPLFLPRLGPKHWPLLGLGFRRAFPLTRRRRLFAAFGFGAFFANRADFGHLTRWTFLAWRRRSNGFTPDLIPTFAHRQQFCLLGLRCSAAASPGFRRLGRFLLGWLGRAGAWARAARFLGARIGVSAGGGRRVVVGFGR